MFLHLSVILFTWGVCVSQHALGQIPPSQQTATAADGMHPTGMHSCVNITIEINVFLLSYAKARVNACK